MPDNTSTRGTYAREFRAHAAHADAHAWSHGIVPRQHDLVSMADREDLTEADVTCWTCTAILRSIVLARDRRPTRWGVCGCGILWGPYTPTPRAMDAILAILARLEPRP